MESGRGRFVHIRARPRTRLRCARPPKDAEHARCSAVHVQALKYLYGPGFQMPASAVWMEQAVLVHGHQVLLCASMHHRKISTISLRVPPLFPLSESDLKSLASANLGGMTSIPLIHVPVIFRSMSVSPSRLFFLFPLFSAR